MILVTGGTGFIGRVLIRQLVSSGNQVRTLVRPSRKSPNLPKGVPVEAAVCSLRDERGLRAAMKGVDVVYHLAGTETGGSRADLLNVDIQGTQNVAMAAKDAQVERIFYISHLGADRASAYPVLKAKAIAEHYIRDIGIDYTIIRSAIIYGPNDKFTSGLAALLNAIPFIFLIPGDGSTVLQPLWVEDLVTCMTWALDEPETRNQVISVGGPEYLSFQQIVELVMETIGVRRKLIQVPPAYMRMITVFFENAFPGFPVSIFWMDYLATDRTATLDTIPRTFGLMPSRLGQRIDYLRGQEWRRNLFRMLLKRQRE